MPTSRFMHIPSSNLKVVPVQKLVLHEDFDTKRTAALQAKLVRADELKDPPIVTKINRGRYLVLDGANRTSSAKALGLPSLVVQVVNYHDPSVQLSPWNHVISVPIRQLVNELSKDPLVKLSLRSQVTAHRLLRQRKIIAYLCSRQGQATTITIASTSRRHYALTVLNHLVRFYNGKTVIHRTEESTLKAFHDLPKSVCTLVVFPQLTKDELVQAVARGEVLPSGISRHLVVRRALRVGVPLSLLRSRKLTLVQKQAALDKLIAQRYQQGKVRFYPEGVYLFDE